MKAWGARLVCRGCIAFVFLLITILPDPIAHAASGTVAVVPPATAQACAGALAEAVAELRAARFLAEVVPAEPGASFAPFDAVLRFASAGDSVVVVDLSNAHGPVDLATLRLDCKQRLSRRRVWTMVVEMLWSRPAARTAPPSRNDDEGGTPAAVAKPRRVPVAKAVNREAKSRESLGSSVFFGAAPVFGANAVVAGPSWDIAMIGGYRFAAGWRVGGRLRWPISVATQNIDQYVLRLWTFSAAVESGRVFARPQSFVRPFIGAIVGFNFTLVDVATTTAAQDRRWDSLHAHTLAHVGLMFIAKTFNVFAQLEAGVAHRLTSQTTLPSVQADHNTFITAASIGVLFDY